MNSSLLSGLSSDSDDEGRKKALEYYELLKKTPDGWTICANHFLSDDLQKEEQAQFFCLQIIEHFINTSYVDDQQGKDIQCFFRTVLFNQINGTLKLSGIIKRKIAQLVTLVFRIDYYSRWPTFFADIYSDSGSIICTDMYLNILKNIDSEVVNKEILRSNPDITRNIDLKDMMREHIVTTLVQSWYNIMMTFQLTNPELVNPCIEVIGLYVSWIDISLIANDQFVAIFMQFITQRPLIRESVLDCVAEILIKGMEPIAKLKLVENFSTVLISSGVLTTAPPSNGIYDATNDEDFYIEKLSNLLNKIICQLALVWQKFMDSKQYEQAEVAARALDAKALFLLRFFSDGDDDVTQEVIEALRVYTGTLKQRLQIRPPFHRPGEADQRNQSNGDDVAVVRQISASQQQLDFMRDALSAITMKMKYELNFDFDVDSSDHYVFNEFRRELKHTFNSIAAVRPAMALECVQKHFQEIYCHADICQLPFNSVEVAMYLFFNLGEALPVSHGKHFCSSDQMKSSIMKQFMLNILTSNISQYPHFTVGLLYFEVVTRYDAYFTIDSTHIGKVLHAFLGPGGIQCSDGKVSSRTSYLFSRFIKSMPRNILQPYIHDMLISIDSLLRKNETLNLNKDDLLFIYETASIIIVQSSFDAEKKCLLMKNLLTPIVEGFLRNVELFKGFEVVEGFGVMNGLENEGKDSTADTQKLQMIALSEKISQSMGYASRLSKGFTTQTTMVSCGCGPVFAETLRVFSELGLALRNSRVHTSVRQYTHRMLVCLDEDVLTLLPGVVHALLLSATARDLYEFMPLIYQAIGRFKKAIVPLLSDLFMPLNNTIFHTLCLPIDESLQEATLDRRNLRKNYFMFISTIVVNNITEVIHKQEKSDFDKVMATIVQGAVDDTDPYCQKLCFSIFTRLITSWTRVDNKIVGFDEFIFTQIIPCCFTAPMADGFNFKDAQSIFALNEDAKCLKTIYKQFGDQMITYLRESYFKTIQLTDEIRREFCIALNNEPSVFKTYFKQFFIKLKH